MSSTSEVADLLEVDVPVGGRVMVVADLHLRPEHLPGQHAALSELATSIRAASGPGVLLVAGNFFDPAGADADPTRAFGSAMEAHGRLCDAIAAYASGAGRRVVMLPGDRDAALASSPAARRTVTQRLGAEMSLAVDLAIETGAGRRRVRVEPGHRLEATTRWNDPRNPLESPYATHLRNEVLPTMRFRADGDEASRRLLPERVRPPRPWLAGVEHLDDVGALSRFVASRLVYRRLVGFGWLLLIPVIAAFALGLPATVVRSARSGALTTRNGLFVAGTVLELLLLVVIAIAAIRVTDAALGAVSLEDHDQDPNSGARAAAREMITAGFAGLITARTCRPELLPLGPGFYANTGTCADVVSEHPSRLPGLGLPSVFLAHRTLSWVELEAGNDLHARLLFGRQWLPGATVVERLVADREESPTGDLRPTVVATFPGGDPWPPPVTTQHRDRTVRRAAAALLVAVGFLSILSAAYDPMSDRLHLVTDLFPVSVPETAAAVTAFFGVGLVVLARGVRRGQRRAWAVCELLLLAVAVLHVIKGVNVAGSAIALAAAVVLYIYRSSFQARTDVAAIRRGLISVVLAAVVVVAAGTLGIELTSVVDRTVARRHQPDFHVTWLRALEATLNRMVGDSSITLPRRINDFASPTLATATAGLVLALLVVLFRPVVARRMTPARKGSLSPAGAPAIRGGGTAGAGAVVAGAAPPAGHDPASLARARAIVARHGSGTLDYFALRPDKDFFFWGDTVVAHAVYGGVCLVSPDPIGPKAERDEVWRAFRSYVDSHGWALGGLGAGEEWLPIYRSTGMHDLYVGDEGVVRIGRFTLEGGKFKGLRQAVNRVAKYGYTISFHDPSNMEPELREKVRAVMGLSRRGDVERGFSMTLGRIFDEADSGLLLAVVHSPGGDPVAFCQYVPAPGIGGYSLDLMRRDNGEHPNGLIDFAVVETIRELRARGCEGLGLNFATMRAVLAGETGEGVTQKVQAWLLKRMGGSMQIESLWRFNAKFDPDWQPRYAIYDAPENALAVAIAVARAESFWELPVIGRFLTPAATPPERS